MQQELSGGPADRHLAAAGQLIERYSWRLLTAHELAEGALALLAVGATDSFQRSLVAAYCLALYRAFAGEEGAERQRLACDELGRTLASMIFRHYPDLPPDEREDVAQNALERVWRARTSCREPIAFLAFASFHLLSAVKQVRQQLRRLGEPLTTAYGDDDEAIDVPDSEPPPLAQVLDKEHRAEIARFLDDLRLARPRAVGQIEVLAMRWLDELSSAEIAQRLQLSPNSIYTRLSRILKSIRDDPDLARRARELGLE